MLKHLFVGTGLLVSLCVFGPAAAQQDPSTLLCAPLDAIPVLGGVSQRRERLERIQTGSHRDHAGVLTADALARGCARAASFSVTPVIMTLVENTDWPADRYEGQLWAGRGFGVSLVGGLELAVGPIRLVAAPEASYQQNRRFAINPSAQASLSEYAFPWSQFIDWPQRFGEGSFSRLSPGNSRLAVGARGGELGLSSENLWVGPALRYPLLLSNAGEGFPHLYARVPAFGSPIGTVELNLFLGRLKESGYYDSDPDNDYRSLSSVSFQLRPTAGFSVGGALLRHKASERIPPLGDLLSLAKSPFALVRGRDDDDNALMSIFSSWALPSAGFEVHGEWGREDFFYDLAELVTDPSHAHAWTLGLSKAGRAGAGTFLLTLEATQLSSDGAWYTNGDIPQGHTNDGQLLAAWVGPGSEAQFFAVDIYQPTGSWWSLEVERVRWAESVYRSHFRERYSFRGHDVELRSSLGHGRRMGEVTVHGSMGLAWRRNRSFLDLDHWSFDWKGNGEFALMMAWMPGQGP